MEYKTKYNIGNKVYTICSSLETPRFFIRGGFLIREIIITHTVKGHREVYILDDPDDYSAVELEVESLYRRKSRAQGHCDWLNRNRGLTK